MVRLPGDLPVWRAHRLLRQARVGSPPRRAGRPLPVTPQRHAALHALVVEAARVAGAKPPRRVALGGRGGVVMTHDRLTIALPLVWGLSAGQLREVVAHELALPATRHAGLARALLAARRQAAARVVKCEDLGDPPRPGDAGLLAATEALAVEAERVRDAAAIDAIGGGLSAVEDAAIAIFRAEAVREGFDSFAAEHGERTAGERALRMLDLHAGWRLLIERWGPPGTGWHPRTPYERIPAAHPGLAAELRQVAEDGEVHRNDLSPGAVVLDPLSEADELALAADARPDATGAWVRFVDLPVEVYRADVERRARLYVEAATAILGRSPESTEELAGVLLRRPVEVERHKFRALFGAEPDETPTMRPWMGAAQLAVVVEYTMIKRGWRREHPLLARRMTGASGSVVDLNELYDRPDELRRYLGVSPDTVA